MFFVFLILWIIFNGNITWEIFWFGVAIAGAMYWFVCRFMGFGPRKDLLIWKRAFLLLRYGVILIAEIIKANVSAMRLLCSERNEIEPVLVHFRTTLRTRAARVLLANSITLTPGTITVSLEGDELSVHCLDKSLAQGLADGIFAKELERLERVK